MTITIYTTTSCQACHLTKRALDRRGITYRELDAAAHRDQLISAGCQQLPVIVTPTETWTGYRPDKLANIRRTA
ncbi:MULTISPECIES: glutaredoxin domain-containing protein [unclassified Actinobaculum]|uniref:glutaredoxin domain-containing protein n=1 Tax=unclassified Actinobaculum TaxID=2609299 RepID=UPI000D526193|nr:MULTISPECIES: glutaredoxin domain-containing protein [unclassified Actinobaculum]AWE42845.1 NrdH-redoxin [Actinobaculum sp. 313]RTE49075.1 NrdH-redoxin [Actinobaculum sp. 352]